MLSSSAVPVLPATTPEPSAADTPVPRATTATMSFLIVCAVCVEMTRRGGASCPGRIVGVRWIPSLAIAWATIAICSGVARTLPWPMALDPSSSFDAI